MTRLLIALLTLLVSLSGPAMGGYSDFERSSLAAKTIRPIKTPYGDALQSTKPAALAARQQVTEGATLYRVGTTGKSAAGEAQFWALESPLSPGFAQRYGIPAENVLKADFIETDSGNQ